MFSTDYRGHIEGPASLEIVLPSQDCGHLIISKKIANKRPVSDLAQA